MFLGQLGRATCHCCLLRPIGPTSVIRPKFIPSTRIYYAFIPCTAVLCLPVIPKLLHRCASDQENRLSSVYVCFFFSPLQRFTLLCDNKSPVWAKTGEASSEMVLEARAKKNSECEILIISYSTFFFIELEAFSIFCLISIRFKSDWLNLEARSVVMRGNAHQLVSPQWVLVCNTRPTYNSLFLLIRTKSALASLLLLSKMLEESSLTSGHQLACITRSVD